MIQIKKPQANFIKLFSFATCIVQQHRSFGQFFSLLFLFVFAALRLIKLDKLKPWTLSEVKKTFRFKGQDILGEEQ